jgi:uncharacterized protein YprB with RNaseH-like and TPR domain
MNQDSKLNIYLNLGKARPRPEVKPKFQPPRIGYLRETKLGDIWVVDWQYESGHLHGNRELTKIDTIPVSLDFNLNGFNPSAATILDTETTGLAGGTGTYAFIIGAGFWQADKFIVRQYMMRDFNEEPAQLMALAEDFSGSVITYNGKCFDLPLLTNRYRLHRFEIPFTDAPHLDLLFPCRRLWKRSLPGFKLTQMEEAVLGYARVDDIPSHLIPSIFFDYLQNRDETLLYPILNHNRDDILSLYHLTHIAASLVNQYLENGGNDDDITLSLAEIYFNQRDYYQAIALIDKINPQFASSATLKQASMMKAVACKRLGRYQEAVDSFATINTLEPELDFLIELAKIYEHKLKDFDKALEMVRQAESVLELMSYLGQADEALNGQLNHRKNRLQRKVNRLLHI